MDTLRKEGIPFTQVPNEIINDNKISLKAKGLYCYLQSKPDKWQFSAERIAQESKEDIKAIRSGLKELEQSGYLKRKRKNDGRVDYLLKYIKNKHQSAKTAQSQNGTEPKRHRAKTAPISNIVTINNKDTKVIKKLSSVEDTEEIFSFKEKLDKMKTSKDIRMRVIYQYWTFKGLEFNNKPKYESALKRELRPAGLLRGYEWEEVEKTMKWLENNADFKWTLESIHKYIDEVDYLQKK